jgi:uncharacterized protein
MKKTIIIFGLALVAFANVSFASNSNFSNKSNVEIIIKPSPFCNAVIKGDLETLKSFVAYGEDVNEVSNGATPLIWAVRYNKVEVVKFLLEKGAKQELKDDKGYTALQHAKKANATEILALLSK